MKRVSKTIVKNKMEDALKRHAGIDAKSVDVETQGSKVILKGKVHSWH